MLDSLLIILSNPLLLIGLVLCALLGGGSLLTAIHLCSIKGVIASSTKYLLAVVSIESIVNFFMIMLNPREFLYVYPSDQSLLMILGLLMGWILFYEANRIIKNEKLRSTINKHTFSKICSNKTSK